MPPHVKACWTKSVNKVHAHL
uniref:Uncharacterized protein n=1 Tax=Rhizophora mucronata TaxID=61149 RepID=A0A2P2PH34_RHIMU